MRTFSWKIVVLLVTCVTAGTAFGMLVGGFLAPQIAGENWVKSYQTLIVGILSVSVAIGATSVAWRSVQRQLAAREEDRIERLLPGLERAETFLNDLYRDLSWCGTFGGYSPAEILRNHGLLRANSTTQKDVDEVLPLTDPRTRDRIVVALREVIRWAEWTPKLHGNIDVIIDAFDPDEFAPGEHPKIVTSEREQQKAKEREIKAAANKLYELQKELSGSAASYRTRLRAVREEIERGLGSN